MQFEKVGRIFIKSTIKGNGESISIEIYVPTKYVAHLKAGLSLTRQIIPLDADSVHIGICVNILII